MKKNPAKKRPDPVEENHRSASSSEGEPSRKPAPHPDQRPVLMVDETLGNYGCRMFPGKDE